MDENGVRRKLKMQPFFVTIPHSGETIPSEAPWLGSLPAPVLLRDVDRFVDQLYKSAIEQHCIPHITATCHRYVIDLNRLADDYDQDSVAGASLPSGTHPKGLHWSVTTFGERLISQPMPKALHDLLVKNYYEPFHAQMKQMVQKFAAGKQIFHLDLHSMPSQGTAMHNDPGQKRADIVVSDFHGKSARKDFVDAVIEAYKGQGFEVAYNWPYFGGGITQMYGRPEQGHHTVQVELNRSLYMNEDTKEKSDHFLAAQTKLSQALSKIFQRVPSFLG